MKNLILDKLEEIEDEFHVKVLFAVESGSRAWGYSSNDSDYDVRFIYCPSPQWYLSIDPQGVGGKKDVIEVPINNDLDMNGWEITKALRLFRKSNPTIFEWLKSEIVYYQVPTFFEQLNALELSVFNTKVCLYHYFNIARTNYRKCSQNSKLYFYVLRSLFVCHWIVKNQTFPPIHFEQLLQILDINNELKVEINTLLNLKRNSNILGFHGDFKAINEFIEHELIRLQEFLNSHTVSCIDHTEQLNHLFRETLKTVWGNSI
ncbi:hypothetical protein SAMN05880501_105121 [Ureibacillus xyleni]|uniref:Nucleotidyltransferase n=1 Tax=Ureibacillus xyleni TaxID=614648 RepID=A0A285SL85_9BACL|nr:nucleotidyltransferase domain-containing protein [Ureibacillus xyleni]SOC08670.1 hypothetical protein SAMN05880501_105121 [Ureibacillus xyleni]